MVQDSRGNIPGRFETIDVSMRKIKNLMDLIIQLIELQKFELILKRIKLNIFIYVKKLVSKLL